MASKRSGEARVQLIRRLDAISVSELASYFGITAHERRGWAKGEEADGLLAWLTVRDRFDELREALPAVDREDLLSLLETGASPPTSQPYSVIEQTLSRHFQDANGVVAKLRTSLEADHRIAVHAVHGMGGVGKTQLALKYSQDYRDHYAGVWWLGSETENTLQRDAQQCCEAGVYSAKRR